MLKPRSEEDAIEIARKKAYRYAEKFDFFVEPFTVYEKIHCLIPLDEEQEVGQYNVKIILASPAGDEKLIFNVSVSAYIRKYIDGTSYSGINMESIFLWPDELKAIRKS